MVDVIDQGMIADWKVPGRMTASPLICASRRMATPPTAPNSVIAYNPNKVTPEEIKLLSDWRKAYSIRASRAASP